MKIPALQVSVNDLGDIVPPEAETGGILIVPYLFQFLEMGFDALVVSAGLRVSRLINFEGVEVGHGLWHEIRVTPLAPPWRDSRQVAFLVLM
jgi:hypothetical protein